MMTQTQYLLLLTMEECGEVAHRCSKAIRFGPDDVEDGQALTATQRLEAELADLFVVLGLLEEEIGRPMLAPSPDVVRAKRIKVATYMALSRKLGQLDPETP